MGCLLMVDGLVGVCIWDFLGSCFLVGWCDIPSWLISGFGGGVS